MAYGYQKPPMYDDDANVLVVRMLAFAPVLYAGNAVWLFSNQQVFQASAVVDDSDKLFPISGHTWSQFSHQITPGSVWLGVWPTLLLYWIYAHYFKTRCGHLSRKEKNDDQIKKYSYAILDEKWVPTKKVFPNDIKKMEYLNLLKKSDAKAWWKEETRCQQYNYKKLH